MTSSSVARDEDADVVVAGYLEWDDDSDTLQDYPGNVWVDCDDFIAQQLGEGWSSHYSAFLFRHALIRDIPHRQEFAPDDRLFIIEVALKKPRLAVYRKPAFIHRQHHRARMQGSSGLMKTLRTWQYIMAYRKTLALLERDGELSPRRRRAPLRFLWSLARELAKTHPADASDIYDWIYELDPDFTPPIRRSLAFAYRMLGFRRTESLVKLRASAKRWAGRRSRAG